MRQSKYSTSGEYLIGVYPLDKQLPIYCRDAELYSGTVDAIMSWVRGIEHQKEYIMMLRATSDEKIKTLEENYIKNRVQRGMLNKIKNPDQKLDHHTQQLIDLHKESA